MRNLELLSVVVPCHNEEAALPETHATLAKILDGLAAAGKISDYEILYVDNGSTDGTLKEIKKICDNGGRARGVSLRNNFGYQGSISAGLAAADGDAVVTIDADLQDDPEKIADMADLYRAGRDLVLGVRSDRSEDGAAKRFFSQGYYRLLKLLGADVVHNHGDFRLMARPLVDEFNSMSERNRFIRGMILRLDSHYAVVEYKRRPRRLGTSKFGAADLFSLGMDGIISFTYAPLRMASLFGILFFALGLAGAAWVLYIKIFTDVIPGWASTLFPIFLIGGFQMLFLGIIGEYIGRLYVEVKHRPLFVIREKFGRRKRGAD